MNAHCAPPEKQHEPWAIRVTGQLQAALTGLETALASRPLPNRAVDMMQAGVTAAISWHFIQQMLPQVGAAAQYPALAAFSGAAETLAPFQAAAHGAGVCAAVIP